MKKIPLALAAMFVVACVIPAHAQQFECKEHYTVVVLGLERFCLMPHITSIYCGEDGTEFATSLDTGKEYCVDHDSNPVVKYPPLSAGDTDGNAGAPVVGADPVPDGSAMADDIPSKSDIPSGIPSRSAGIPESIHHNSGGIIGIGEIVDEYGSLATRTIGLIIVVGMVSIPVLVIVAYRRKRRNRRIPPRPIQTRQSGGMVGSSVMESADTPTRSQQQGPEGTVESPVIKSGPETRLAGREAGRKHATGTPVTKSESGMFGVGIRHVKKPKRTPKRYGEEELAKDGPIFLDTSAVLYILKGQITPHHSIVKRIGMTPTVYAEVTNRIAKDEDDEYDTSLLPRMEDLLERPNEILLDCYIKEMENIHEPPLECYENPNAKLGSYQPLDTWICSKREQLKNKWGINVDEDKDAVDRIDLWPKLYYNAKNDRKVVAEAASLFNNEASLVTGDNDMLVFYKEINKMTYGRLKICRRDALSKKP